MKKITVFMIVVLLFSVVMGVTAFANEEEALIAEPTLEASTPDAPTNVTPVEVSNPESPVIENQVAKQEQTVDVTSTEVETEPDIKMIVRNEGSSEIEDPKPESKVESNPEPENIENIEEPKETDKTTTEGPEEPAPVVESADTASQVSYSITFSNGASSFDTVGGTQVAVKDILAGLGYSVENAVITVNPDTIDTSVIQITETEEGLILSDFGPFAEANQKLMVYINGEAVELSVIDPTEISGDMSADDFIAAFSSCTDGNVKLTGNVKITTSGTSITLSSGIHDLYLNGKELNLGGLCFTTASNATLNIYGGADRQTAGDGVINGSGSYVLEAKENSIINMYSGSVTGGETGIFASGQGSVNVYGGSVNADTITNATGCSKVNIVGGTFSGAFPIKVTDTCKITVVGGTFSTEPNSSYLLKDNGTACVKSDKNETVTYPEYTVNPTNGYNCVRILSDGTMTGHIGLDSAFSCNGTVVLIDNIADNVTVQNKDIILDLNGFVLTYSITDKNSIIVFTDSLITIKDTNRTKVHNFKVGSNGLWTLTTENATKTYESLTAIPDANDVIAVEGGCITGAKGPGVNFGSSSNPKNLTIENGNFIGNSGSGLIVNNCPVVMNGGIFSGNIGAYGAGICIQGNQASDIEINGGCISYNTSTATASDVGGGGIYFSGRSLNIIGTTISYNKATYGGGVYSKFPFTMSGGSIIGNEATYGGGVYTAGTGAITITLGGTATISGNKSGSGESSTVNNVYLRDGQIIKVNEGFSGSVGVSTSVLPSAGNPVAITGKNSSDYSSCFFSDNVSYFTYNSDNTVKLGIAEQGKKAVITNTGEQYKSVADAVSAATSGQTVKMIADTEENIIIDKDKNITLNLNGFVINGAGKGNVITNKGTLTLTDSNPTAAHAGSYSSLPKGGVITRGSGKPYGGGVYNCGTFTMTGGSINGNSASESGGGVYNDSSSIFTMTGGNIVGNSASMGGGVANLGTATLGGTARITDNTATMEGANFLILNYRNLVNISAAATGMGIGITLVDDKFQPSTGPFTTNGTADDTQYFTSDYSKYTVGYNVDGRYLELVLSPVPVPDPAPSPVNAGIGVSIIVEPIAFESLSIAQQKIVNETLKANNLKLIATIQVYKLSGNTRINKGQAQFEFNASILSGNNPSILRVWKINDDNTMTEVPFEVVSGKIIFNPGDLGTYILAI